MSANSIVDWRMQAILQDEDGLRTIERVPSMKGRKRRMIRSFVKGMETHHTIVICASSVDADHFFLTQMTKGP